MTPDTNTTNSRGKFVSRIESWPPIVADCSGWVTDTPPEQWSRGKFVPLAEAGPAVVVDCSGWSTNVPVVQFEPVVLKVTLVAGANVEEVRSEINRLVDFLDHWDQAQGGAGIQIDFDRSHAEPGMLTLMLVSTARQTGSDAAQRFLEKVQMLASHLSGSSGVARAELSQAA